MNPKLLWTALALMLLALVALVVVRAWPVLFPTAQLRLEPDPECDLHSGPCRLEVPGRGIVSLSIAPRPVPLIQPLQLRVEAQGLEARQVDVDFLGINMYMGFNRSRLNGIGDGVYVGEGRLPVCVHDRMEWEARVLFQGEQGLVSAPFRFTTLKSTRVNP